jgi:type I restriction enzyme R subunit
MIYSKPFAQRRLTYEAIKQLAEAIRKPPYHLTPEALWLAYQHLEQAKVKGAGPQKLLTNIVSLLRFALGQSEVLEPFADTVDRRFHAWLQQQVKAGREFTPEQMEWLEMIKAHVAASVHIEMDDFDDTPFYGKGGRLKAHELFGENLQTVLEELNEVLTT